MRPLLNRRIVVMIVFSLLSTVCYASEIVNDSHAIAVASKQSKCSAPGVDDFEVRDMSGVTPKCKAIFDACVDQSAPCGIRKRKCMEFDRMDRSGSCYKKRQS